MAADALKLSDGFHMKLKTFKFLALDP